MSRENLRPTYWALLIGVGLTVDRSRFDESAPFQDRSLEGAVEDIKTINEFLSTQSNNVDITILQVTKPPTGNILDTPTEPSSIWPTYKNVTKCLFRIIESGKSGDRVYIHFSGHGTRRKSTQGQPDVLALSLFDPGNLGQKYLHGEILRSGIQRMTHKDMHVSLVLDCCFSGSVLRADYPQSPTARFIEYNAAVDAESEHVDPFIPSLGMLRDSDVISPSILDPRDYIVISACAHHEQASELSFQGGPRRGALSYFLFDSLATLRRRGVTITHHSLYLHLRASFHAYYPHQTPMMYGNVEREGFTTITFFDQLCAQHGSNLVPLYRRVKGHSQTLDAGQSRTPGLDQTQTLTPDQSLVLDAGQAHGVHQGDKYAVYTFDTAEDTKEPTFQSSFTVQVSHVNPLHSEVKISEISDSDQIKQSTAWRAKLISSLSTQKTGVMLKNVSDREYLTTIAAGHPYLQILTGDESMPCVFQVDYHDDLGYKIQDMLSRPVLESVDIPSPDNLVDILGHIASFKYFEQLENKNVDPVFEKSFSLSCDSSPGPDGYYEVPHGDTLTFTLKVLDNSVKYISIYNFTSLWEVRCSTTGNGGGNYFVEPGTLPVGGKLQLRMTLPQESLDNRDHSTEEIFKFFITSRPTVFPGLVLPKATDGNRREDDNEEIATLLGRLRHENPGYRGDGQEDWSAWNFLVRITAP